MTLRGGFPSRGGDRHRGWAGRQEGAPEQLRIGGAQTPWPQQSPELGPRAFACSAVVPLRGDAGAAARSVDRQIRVSLVVGSELPALAPGARCRVGRSMGSGAPEADL
jgi:hypothetical protein